MRRGAVLALVVLALLALGSGAATAVAGQGSVSITKAVSITRKDRCPVCGMFVYKYPKWVARITFGDGSAFFYDGAKCMFTHDRDPARYSPGKAWQDVTAISVTDYYETELVDARTAWFVIGSDVLGPMGHELIPFRDEAAAREFMADHGGKGILRFGDVTEDTLRALGAGPR